MYSRDKVTYFLAGILRRSRIPYRLAGESLTTVHSVMYSIQIHAEIQQLNEFTFLQKSLKNLKVFYCLLCQKQQKKNTRMVMN